MTTVTSPSSPTYASKPLYLSLVASDVAQVDRVIANRLSSGVPLVGQVATYIIQAGGKRLRPVLLLLIAGLLKVQSSDKHKLAAVVEFIHTATLLHDDVVDDSSMRRGRATANETFGNAASVLVGDFLYSRAFQMMVEVDKMRVLSILADATNVIAEGEVLQLMNMHDAGLSPERYLQVIESKTAKLFEAAARLGALLAGVSAEVEVHCANYGAALGTAFQLVDDVLDYTGNAAEMGKNLGDDLREGKATLPLIVAMERASSADASVIKTAIEEGDLSKLDQVVQIVRESGALEASMDFAREQVNRAVSCIETIPLSLCDEAYRAALLELPSLSLVRRS